MPNAESLEPRAQSPFKSCPRVLGDYLTRIKTSAPLYDLSEDDLWAHAAAAQLAVRAITQECPGAQHLRPEPNHEDLEGREDPY